MSTPIENAMALAIYSHHTHWSRERADKFAGVVCDVLRTYRVMVPFVSLWMASGDVVSILGAHPCRVCDGIWALDDQPCVECHRTGLDLPAMVTALGGVVRHSALVDVLCDE
jgi:hypothetical protein